MLEARSRSSPIFNFYNYTFITTANPHPIGDFRPIGRLRVLENIFPTKRALSIFYFIFSQSHPYKFVIFKSFTTSKNKLVVYPPLKFTNFFRSILFVIYHYIRVII